MMERYATLLSAGWVPIWTGTMNHLLGDNDSKKYDSAIKLHVRLARGEHRIWHVLKLKPIMPDRLKALIKHTAIEPGSNIALLPSMTSDVAKIRTAAVLGIAPFTAVGTGMTKPLPLLSSPRIVGLDIEQSTYERDGLFPLAHDPLISIAIVTWEGKYMCGITQGRYDASQCAPTSDYQIIKFDDSNELADWAMDWLIMNVPDFICIHNGFKYDIARLAAHCSSRFARYFTELNLGKTDKGYDLMIPGSTVIDTSWFLQKLHNVDYPSFNLDSLAYIVGEEGKREHPTMNISPDDTEIDMTRMIMYNIHDAYLHVKVAINTRCIDEICTMCSVFKSPIFDMTRFISGTAVCSMASSFALSRGLVIDWSDEGWEAIRFKGAHVMPPLVGLHKDVTVLDFASMYPSIIIGANISTETIHRVENEDLRQQLIREYDLRTPDAAGDVIIRWNEYCMIMRSSDVVYCIDRRRDGIAKMICKELIARRRSLADKNSAEGWTLKIGTNSIYGVFGAATSGMCCKLAAISVTAIGRFILGKLAELAEHHGFKVLYGDTDSVFIKALHTCTINPSQFMDIYHSWSRGTPFEPIKLEFDKSYDELILIKPKIYYGRPSGKTYDKAVVKGMATKRRDRPDISRDILRDVCRIICQSSSDTVLTNISSIIYQTIRSLRSGHLDPIRCMKEVKINGIIMYSYRSQSGRQITIDKSKFDNTIPEPIDVDWIIASIESSLSGVDTLERPIQELFLVG